MKLNPLINRAIDMLRDAQHVVALTGAGISTPSGIPDYRSPKSGLWEKGPDMMEVASIYAFRHNPQAFFEWLRPLLYVIREAQPNPAHIALAQLEAAGRLQALVTQNIDLLHGRAGSRNLYEVHGHLREAVCPACHLVAPSEPYLEAFMATGQIPRCYRCHHVMKPNVVLFGELLPQRIMKAAQMHARSADLCLVVGSSLEVAPAGDLPMLTKANGGRLIIINFGETHMDDQADVVIHADVAQVLPHLAEPFLSPPTQSPQDIAGARPVAGKNQILGGVSMDG
jgi:NAD-dependent deacetylase